MNKLFVSVATLVLLSSALIHADASSEVARLKAETSHLQAQINKNVTELGRLREQLARAEAQAYTESKTNQQKSLRQDRARAARPTASAA
jgi:predicted RNase H-like nuclease (RuvC/YqgF family)